MWVMTENMVVIGRYLMMTHAKLKWLVVTRRNQHLLLFLFFFQVRLSCAQASVYWSTGEPEDERL